MIRDDIKAAQIAAMKAGDKDTRNAIGLIQAAIKNRDIEARAPQSKAGKAPDDDDALVVEVLQKMVKQRRESIEMYRKGDREELAKAEETEVTTIERFLPCTDERGGDDGGDRGDQGGTRRERYEGHGPRDGRVEGATCERTRHEQGKRPREGGAALSD